MAHPREFAESAVLFVLFVAYHLLRGAAFADGRTTPAVDSYSAPGMVASGGRGCVQRRLRTAVRSTVLAKRRLSLRSQAPGRQCRYSPGRTGVAAEARRRCRHARIRRGDLSFPPRTVRGRRLAQRAAPV